MPEAVKRVAPLSKTRFGKILSKHQFGIGIGHTVTALSIEDKLLVRIPLL